MKSVNKAISSYANGLNKAQILRYEQLPNIELYMDQMMGFLNVLMTNFKPEFDEKAITSSMVNNYVKDEVIPKPLKKKYSKEHIAYLVETIILKNALSIDDIKDSLAKAYSSNKNLDVYNGFIEDYQEILAKSTSNMKKELKQIEDNDLTALNELAIKLAITSSINKMLSEKLLHYIKVHEEI